MTNHNNYSSILQKKYTSFTLKTILFSIAQTLRVFKNNEVSRKFVPVSCPFIHIGKEMIANA